MDIEQVIQDNLGLMYKQLKRFNLGYNDDAISYAMEALWSAAKTFDPDAGIKFSTYATTCIYNGIMRYFRDSKNKLDCISYETDVAEDIKLIDMLADTPYTEDRIDAIYELLYDLADECTKASHTEVIRAWIDSNFEISQRELAKRFGYTQSAVSRILVVYKYKLRQELEGFL